MRLRAVVVGAVLVASMAGGSLPARADLGHLQGITIREWHFPGTADLDGIGGWVYVDAPTPPGPGQLSNRDYVYEWQFFFRHGGMGAIGLGADAGGPLVGLRLSPPGLFDPVVAPVTIRYPWQPGRIYFLLAYDLGNGAIGGWVYDLGAATWTYFGTIQAPSAWGGLAPASAATIHGALGMPLPAPYAVENLETPKVADCSQFPRAGVWFSEPLAWRGPDILSNFEYADDPGGIECPIRTEEANGWWHQVVGTLPTAS